MKPGKIIGVASAAVAVAVLLYVYVVLLIYRTWLAINLTIIAVVLIGIGYLITWGVRRALRQGEPNSVVGFRINGRVSCIEHTPTNRQHFRSAVGRVEAREQKLKCWYCERQLETAPTFPVQSGYRLPSPPGTSDHSLPAPLGPIE